MSTAAPTRHQLADGGWVDLWTGLLPEPDWLLRLEAELPLMVERYFIHGREVPSPRLVSWHGDPGSGYAYSGVHHEPVAWTPGLSEVRARIHDATGLTFNSVLANLYRDGADSMGWHADKEPELGPTPDDRWIASMSFGAERRFLLRHRRDAADQLELRLGGGTLLVMRGTTQTHYRHAVPKTRKAVGPRLNLTFRRVVETK